MTKQEFIKSTAKVFESFGCKRHKKVFSYEHEDFYLFFDLWKSSYSDCYYLHINTAIKELHAEIAPQQHKRYDLAASPRITLLDGTWQLMSEELEADKYEGVLRKTVEIILERVKKLGIRFVKDLENVGDKVYSGGILTKEAEEYLAKL